MSPTFTPREQYILRFTAAMGWIGKDGVIAKQYADEIYVLTGQNHPPLFRSETGGGPDRYRLTPAGDAEVEKLGGPLT